MKQINKKEKKVSCVIGHFQGCYNMIADSGCQRSFIYPVTTVFDLLKGHMKVKVMVLYGNIRSTDHIDCCVYVCIIYNF